MRQLPDWNLLGGKGNCMHVMLCRLLHKCGRPVFMHRLRGGQIRERHGLSCMHLVCRGKKCWHSWLERVHDVHAGDFCRCDGDSDMYKLPNRTVRHRR